MKKMIVIFMVVTLLVTLGSVPVLAAKEVTGNGCPSGPHYNLNIIGVSKSKTAPMDNNNGHRIFVPLGTKNEAKSTKIYLSEGDFAVLDANGTDGNGAKFQLPNPDPDEDGTTLYSVFIRVLGKPGGKIKMTTQATDPTTGEPVVSDLTLVKVRQTGKGKQKFENVSAELLYIYAYVCVGYDAEGNPIYEYMRVPLFSELLQGYLWKVDNNGCKLAQLRFYEVSTTVPEPEDVQP
jgi:hypothetical protein